VRIEGATDERWHRRDAPTKGGRPRIVGGGVETTPLGVQALDPGVERFGRDPLGQRFRAMDLRKVRGDRTRLWLRVEAVDEASLDAGAEVEKWQRIDRGIEPGRETGGVLVWLKLDATERVAGGLGLEHTPGLAVDEEQVVGEAVT